MHICFASLDYPTAAGGGGVGTYVRALGRELVRLGHQVSVIALASDRLESPFEDQGIKVYIARSGNLHWYASRFPVFGNFMALAVRELEYSWAAYRTILSIDKMLSVDIVEGTETGILFYGFLPARIRTVSRLHGETYTFYKHTPPGNIPISIRISRVLQRRALRRVDILTSPSKAHAEEIEDELRLPNGSVEVVPNPIDPFVSPILSESRARFRKLFLFVGRIERRKGVMDLLAAIPSIKKAITDAEFVFAGCPHFTIQADELSGLVKNLNIEESVKFVGHLPADQLEVFYREASVIVIPSYYETFGYVYLEAMKHLKPIVAYDAGAARETITDGENGILVPVGNIVALADACVLAAGQGRFSVDNPKVEKFNPSVVSKQLLDIYRRIPRTGAS